MTSGRIKGGGILLSVHSDNADWTKRAKQIMEDTGAQDVSSSSEAKADYAKSDKPMPRSRTQSPGADPVEDNL